VPLVLIPLTVAASMLIRRPLTRLLGANMQESAQRTAHLFETMNGVDTLKSLGAEAWARRQWEMLTVKISENSVQMREWTSFGTYLSLLVTNLSAILIVMFGALMIGAGELTMGQLIAVSMLAARAITPATQIAALIVRYEQTRQALEALDKIMESPTDETTDSLHLPRMPGRLDFRDVHFAYPDGAPLLKGPQPDHPPGRAGRLHRPHRLGQEHPVQAAPQPLRPRPGHRDGGRHGREPARTPEPAPPGGLRAPGRGALSR
jgi:ATP-binding cassette subfamily C protein LapB